MIRRRAEARTQPNACHRERVPQVIRFVLCVRRAKAGQSCNTETRTQWRFPCRVVTNFSEFAGAGWTVFIRAGAREWERYERRHEERRKAGKRKPSRRRAETRKKIGTLKKGRRELPTFNVQHRTGVTLNRRDRPPTRVSGFETRRDANFTDGHGCVPTDTGVGVHARSHPPEAGATQRGAVTSCRLVLRSPGGGAGGRG